MSQGIHTAARPRLLALVTAALLVALGLLLAPASAAHAHDELLGSDPASGATVDTLPAQLTLTFSNAIATDEGASEVAVTDASGTSLVGGPPSAQDNVLTQPLSGEASGAITVLWKVVSSDGHPISGEFSFTVTAAPVPSETSSPAPTETETVEPTKAPTVTFTPGPDQPAAAADLTPWIVLAIVAVLVAAAVTYLLVSRSRREKALAESRDKALGGGPEPDSEPPADR